MHILVLDGIGSHNTTSKVIDHTVNHLKGKINCDATWVNWKAAMAGVGGTGSWRDNSREGVAMIKDQFLSNEREQFILLAYSGGNRVVHEFLEQFPHLHNQVAAVGLMSDPWRPSHKWQNGTEKPIGFGICGQDEGPLPDCTYWTAVHDDVITSARPDALMRYMADVSSGDPDQIINDAIEAGRKGRFQLALFLGLPPLQWLMGLGPRIDQFSRDAQGYLGGRHTSAYTAPYKNGDSLAIRLANTIAWKVRDA